MLFRTVRWFVEAIASGSPIWTRPESHNRRVRIALWIAIFSCSIETQAQPQTIDSRWITVRQPRKWQSPPRELHLKTKTGPAEIMVLYPSGDYGYVACYLIRQADGSVNISRGDGFVVKIGKWSGTKSTVTIKSQTVYREIVISGRAIPEPEVVEEFRSTSRAGYWRLRLADRHFEPLPNFRDFDFLASVIACDREYYNGKDHLEGPQPCRSPGRESK